MKSKIRYNYYHRQGPTKLYRVKAGDNVPEAWFCDYWGRSYSYKTLAKLCNDADYPAARITKAKARALEPEAAL